MYRITESTVPGKAPRIPEDGRWTTGLFQCCLALEEADEEGCEWVLICPSILHARIAGRLRGDSYRLSCCTYAFAWAYCAWLFAAPLRSELRRKYSLPEEPCSDCMAHLFCSPLAVWQEYRELEAREGIHFYILTDLEKQKAEPEGPQEPVAVPVQQEVVEEEVVQVMHQEMEVEEVEAPEQEIKQLRNSESRHQRGDGGAATKQHKQEAKKQEEQHATQHDVPEQQTQRDLRVPSLTEADQPDQEHRSSHPVPESIRVSPAGTLWRKLNPADSYKKKSTEIEEEPAHQPAEAGPSQATGASQAAGESAAQAPLPAFKPALPPFKPSLPAFKAPGHSPTSSPARRRPTILPAPKLNLAWSSPARKNA